MRFPLRLFALFLLPWTLGAAGADEVTTPAGESLALLEKLIAIDTTNPPGNELKAAEFVRDYLAREGIPSEILEPAPGRGNLIARLPGAGKAEPLLLLGHLDVVPADPKEWKSPPLQPRIEDGYLYGRGALDMKGLVALQIRTFVRLKREAVKLDGDVILALVADEEAGGKLGAGFLVDKHWDKVKAGYVFGEGSVGLARDGLHLYPIQVAEKGVAWMRLTARGASGHGSMPAADNAVAKLARAVDRIASWRQPIVETPIAARFLAGLAERFSFPKSFLMKHLFDWPIAPLTARFFGGSLEKEKILNAMLRNTATPTVLQAGSKTNVIPATAVAEIDARILPGETPETYVEKVRARVADPGIAIELIQANAANQSSFDTPYFAAVETSIRRHDPEAVVLPFVSPGATDNRFFRGKGTLAYGIIPFLIQPKDLAGLHGKNEAIPVAELERGEKVLWDLVISLQAEKTPRRP